MNDDSYREPPTDTPSDEATRGAAESAEYALAEEVVDDDEQQARWYARRRLARAHELLTAALQGTDPPQQLSLRYLLGLMTAASLIFAVARLVEPELFSGLCGLAVLSTGVLLNVFFPKRTLQVEAAWWAFLCVYLISIFVASFSGK